MDELKENEILEPAPVTEEPDEQEYQPTDEDIERWERERQEREAALIAPFKAAGEQRKQTAEIAAEHDEIISDLLYNSIMSDLGLEE